MEETNFIIFTEDQLENAEPSNDIKANSNDDVSPAVTPALEKEETRSCEDTSKISEDVKIGFEDEKEAADFRKCLGNRTVVIILSLVTIIAVAVFVPLLAIYAGNNDSDDFPGKSYVPNVTKTVISKGRARKKFPKYQELCWVFLCSTFIART